MYPNVVLQDLMLVPCIQGVVPLKPGRDLDWNEEVAKAKPCDAVPVHSEHPLYILYTSGTTGTPKVSLYFNGNTYEQVKFYSISCNS